MNKRELKLKTEVTFWEMFWKLIERRRDNSKNRCEVSICDAVFFDWFIEMKFEDVNSEKSALKFEISNLNWFMFECLKNRRKWFE